MLTAADNELLTRVGPEATMGRLMRQYWLPVLLSNELPARDGRPMRVRVLGESLVAFRDTNDRIGLIDERCPHRRASLYYGRNEEGGLRCVYHGWKFDIAGNCLDLPSEPPEAEVRHRIRARAFPCVERNGIVWAYFGDGEAPPLPAFEWSLVPPEQRYISKRLLECNWAQALEGDIDTAHASFLHSRLNPTDYDTLEGARELHYYDRDRNPHYEIVETNYGLLMAARRRAEPGSHYWRSSHFLMPVFVMVAPFGDQLPHANVWLPMDDGRTMAWSIDWHPHRPLSDSERASRDSGLNFHCVRFQPSNGEAGSAWQPNERAENDYLFDYSLQQSEMYSGIRPLWAQDKAVQESMGPIVDRRDEHLMPSDVAIARWRRYVLAATRSFAAGEAPAGRDPTTHRLRPVGLVLNADAPWRETIEAESTIAT